ncbi:uncharacterized protein MELLADRAFT_61331 [Melampsora larici-populina 98AG31]|uniref:Uncharacterized protein n=1 Tax=Melampsora larici-populina (strain 98AG31 / pathotype 3-4-7) TaxID=747676 RepID=F4REG7_MELLP|nr:uncharacterized protein MELLADRAFT_61331 [Melampsora larici-populina 98AG31]EGG09274.1 hypothetical protein MELLADRAFT_61331 [Melampsora larici-populina 98AG31]
MAKLVCSESQYLRLSYPLAMYQTIENNVRNEVEKKVNLCLSLLFVLCIDKRQNLRRCGTQAALSTTSTHARFSFDYFNLARLIKSLCQRFDIQTSVQDFDHLDIVSRWIGSLQEPVHYLADAMSACSIHHAIEPYFGVIEGNGALAVLKYGRHTLVAASSDLTIDSISVIRPKHGLGFFCGYHQWYTFKFVVLNNDI